MLLPYRAKNPPEAFPYATLTLIGLNTLVYLLTSYQHFFLVVDDSAIQAMAISDTHFSVLRMFTSMFLHENLLHIGGNMLFFWIFGPAVEGRLKPFKYVVLYLVAGLAGDMLHEVVVGMYNPDMFSLGASGAIMGLAGAYIYMFPFARIRVFSTWIIRWLFSGGQYLSDWHAQWVVLYFLFFDVISGLLFKDGVGHFAHIGGFATGLLIAWLFNAHRDSEDFASVQALRADLKDYNYISYSELEVLMQRPHDNVPMIMAFCKKAFVEGGPKGQDQCLRTIVEHGPLLLENADINQLGDLVLRLAPPPGTIPAAQLLRIGSRLEVNQNHAAAIAIYQRVYHNDPSSRDSEAALLRMGRLYERVYGDLAQAHAVYAELLRVHPEGSMAQEAQLALKGIETRGQQPTLG